MMLKLITKMGHQSIYAVYAIEYHPYCPHIGCPNENMKVYINNSVSE